jgi:uncharacterized membrane protein YbaN (DUF454 family)
MSAPIQNQVPAERPSALSTRGWNLAGSFFVMLGAIGAALPVMPTTVFLILALGCFMRGSPERARRLLEHPRFGPTLSDWQRERAIPRKIKVIAVTSISIAWLLLLASSEGWLLPVIAGAVLLSVCLWISTRPLPQATDSH